MVEPLVLSSSSLPRGEESLPRVSSETPQATGTQNLEGAILPSIQPLAARSPVEEPFDINWQSPDAVFFLREDPPQCSDSPVTQLYGAFPSTTR